jgi:hypothetical protein
LADDRGATASAATTAPHSNVLDKRTRKPLGLKNAAPRRR